VPARGIVCGVPNTLGSKVIVSFPPVRIRQADRLAQVDLADDGRISGVVHDDWGRNPAVFQRFQDQACPGWADQGCEVSGRQTASQPGVQKQQTLLGRKRRRLGLRLD
jgi:hypothetical protein